MLYHTTMKHNPDFAYRIREDTDTPFWLTEPQISEWLHKKKAEVKKNKVVQKHTKPAAATKKKEVSKPVCKGPRTAVKKRTFDEALEALSASEEDGSEDEYS